jgi:hypothetical protein
LTAAARGGWNFAQVGVEEWLRRGRTKECKLAANFMPIFSGHDK